MVKFDSNPENYSSPDMLQLLEGGVLAAITLDKQVNTIINTIVMEPRFNDKLYNEKINSGDFDGRGDDG